MINFLMSTFHTTFLLGIWFGEIETISKLKGRSLCNTDVPFCFVFLIYLVHTKHITTPDVWSPQSATLEE